MRFDEDDGADGDEDEEGTQNPDEKPGGWVGGFRLALGLGLRLGLGLGGLLCTVRLGHALVHSSQAGCTACIHVVVLCWARRRVIRRAFALQSTSQRDERCRMSPSDKEIIVILA